MPIYALSVGKDNLNKFYLEQALYVYSMDKRPESKEKCKKLSNILNRIVRDEVRYGVYNERIILPQETYAEIFG